ncbi:MAG TPA: alpha/beta fold hydrolase, partial [Candidatus Nanoarchaeia archaeon]|nr:alpha/beta fold hydrolase [Candidatus Nanoarchaeia archaeon]
SCKECVVPVIMVHGFTGNPKTWDNMDEYLTDKGYITYRYDYSPGLGDIKVAAGGLSDFVDSIKKEIGVPKVDLIGHSMGGLVSRWYAKAHPENVRKLLMTGTPNHGSSRFNAAKWLMYGGAMLGGFPAKNVKIIETAIAQSTARKQMQPCSDFLNTLNYGRADVDDCFASEDNIGVETWTMAGYKGSLVWQRSVGPNDNFVSVNSVKLNHSNNKLTYLSHGELNKDEHTFLWVDQILTGAVQSSMRAMSKSSAMSYQTEDYQELPMIEGHVEAGEVRSYTFDLYSISAAEISLGYIGEEVEFSLRRPDGLEESNLTEEGNIKTYSLNDPIEGEWQAIVTGGSSDFGIFISVESAISIKQATDKLYYAKNEIVNVSVLLESSGSPITSSGVNAEMLLPDAKKQTMILLDDGLHNDLLANDGIYGYAFDETSIPGTYEVKVNASGTYEGKPYTREIRFSFWVLSQPDLLVKDIYLPNIDGENITIEASIKNLGEDAHNASIEAYDGDILIGRIVMDIMKKATKKAIFNWSNATVGKHNISALISPFNAFIETNYSNNRLTKEVSIYPESIYLNEQSEIMLEFEQKEDKTAFIKVPRGMSLKQGQFDVRFIAENPERVVKLWDRYYRFGKGGHCTAVKIADQGYILTGSPSENIYLLKTDEEGNADWNKTFDWAGDDGENSVDVTSDEGYIITGFTNSYGAGNYDMLAIKTDSYGNIEWNKTFGGQNMETGFHAKQTDDGGYLILGYTLSYGTNGEIYLVKTNATGDMLWTKTFGGNHIDRGHSLEPTSDGGYILSGYSGSYSSGNIDLYLLKINDLGEEEWHKIMGGKGTEKGYDAKQIEDGFIIAGYTNSTGAGLYDMWLIKTDNFGNALWNKTFGGKGFEIARSLIITEDGYLLSGYTSSFSGNYDAYFVKTDNQGNIEWNKTFDTGLDEQIWETTYSDGYYTACGKASEDAYLVSFYAQQMKVDALNDGSTDRRLFPSYSAKISISGKESLVPISISSYKGFAEITNINLAFSYLNAYNLSLQNGWNLISLPLMQVNNSICHLFKNLAVFGYDGTWQYYYNESANNFRELEPAKGYWIKSSEPQELSIAGEEYENEVDIKLKAGWNLIGYPYLTEGNINGNAFSYNNSWHRTNVLEPWKGYWIYSRNDTNLSIE